MTKRLSCQGFNEKAILPTEIVIYITVLFERFPCKSRRNAKLSSSHTGWDNYTVLEMLSLKTIVYLLLGQ